MDWQSCQDMTSAAMDAFGASTRSTMPVFGKLDRASIDEISPELFQQVMSVNVGGTFLCSKAVVPVMREQSYEIINISTSRIFFGLRFICITMHRKARYSV